MPLASSAPIVVRSIGAMGDWTPDTLKSHFDEMLAERRGVDDTHRSAMEQRFTTFDQRIAALQAGWHDRFVSLEKSVDNRMTVLSKSCDDRMAAQSKALDELRRLVYIGLGIAISLEFLMPLLRH